MMNPERELQYSATLQAQKNICVDFMTAYQDQNVQRMLSLSTPQSTVHFVPLGTDGQGTIHELGKNVWTALIQSFPDINNTVHSMSAKDHGIECRVSIRGTQKAEFFGIPNEENTFDCEHIFVFKLNDDHAIEHLEVDWDHSDFVKQLGGG